MPHDDKYPAREYSFFSVFFIVLRRRKKTTNFAKELPAAAKVRFAIKYMCVFVCVRTSEKMREIEIVNKNCAR